MRDYLKAKEQEEFLLIPFIASEAAKLMAAWKKNNNISEEEEKELKEIIDHTNKFKSLVFQRLDAKTVDICRKRLSKYQFRFIDDFQFKKIMRESEDRMKNAVIERDHYEKLTEELMAIYCKGCDRAAKECAVGLYDVFEDNFTPEPTGCYKKCKYGY